MKTFRVGQSLLGGKGLLVSTVASGSGKVYLFRRVALGWYKYVALACRFGSRLSLSDGDSEPLSLFFTRAGIVDRAEKRR